MQSHQQQVTLNLLLGMRIFHNVKEQDISGANVESRTSGMYDSEDNIRISAISTDSLHKVAMENRVIWVTGQTYPYDFAWSPDGLHLYLAYNGDYIRHYTVTRHYCYW